MPLVSVTRLRVRSWRYLPFFFWQAQRSARQAKTAPGNLDVALLRDEGLAFWTRTVWTNEAAMRAFMMSGAHRKAMPHLQEWCDEASIVHWEQDSVEPPSWPEAHRRMQVEGRRSRVSLPSEAHRRFDIPPPRLPAGY